MLLGLRSLIYPAPDLAAAKEWWTAVLGVEPYFDEPFYVGFDIGGYELGLDPGADPEEGPVTYWGVADLDQAAAEMVERGAVVQAPVSEVGESIRMATFRGPAGAVLGLIENPNFAVAPLTSASGPGR